MGFLSRSHAIFRLLLYRHDWLMIANLNLYRTESMRFAQAFNRFDYVTLSLIDASPVFTHAATPPFWLEGRAVGL